MKRASYREAIAWIALNDDPGATDALDSNSIKGNVTVVLIADIFDIDPTKVAIDVVLKRLQNKKGQ